MLSRRTFNSENPSLFTHYRVANTCDLLPALFIHALEVLLIYKSPENHLFKFINSLYSFNSVIYKNYFPSYNLDSISIKLFDSLVPEFERYFGKLVSSSSQHFHGSWKDINEIIHDLSQFSKTFLIPVSLCLDGTPHYFEGEDYLEVVPLQVSIQSEIIRFFYPSITNSRYLKYLRIPQSCTNCKTNIRQWKKCANGCQLCYNCWGDSPKVDICNNCHKLSAYNRLTRHGNHKIIASPIHIYGDTNFYFNSQYLEDLIHTIYCTRCKIQTKQVRQCANGCQVCYNCWGDLSKFEICNNCHKLSAYNRLTRQGSHKIIASPIHSYGDINLYSNYQCLEDLRNMIYCTNCKMKTRELKKCANGCQVCYNCWGDLSKSEVCKNCYRLRVYDRKIINGRHSF